MSVAAAQSREQARQTDGRFGEQPQARPDTTTEFTPNRDWLWDRSQSVTEQLLDWALDYQGPSGTHPTMSRTKIAEMVTEQAWNDHNSELTDGEALNLADQVMGMTGSYRLPLDGNNRNHGLQVVPFDDAVHCLRAGECVCCGRRNYRTEHGTFANPQGLCPTCANWDDSNSMPIHVTYTDQTGWESGMSPTLALDKMKPLYVPDEENIDYYGNPVLDAIQCVYTKQLEDGKGENAVSPAAVADALWTAALNDRYQDALIRLSITMEAEVKAGGRQWTDEDENKLVQGADREARHSMTRTPAQYEPIVCQAVSRMRGIKITGGMISRTDQTEAHK
jgi:hypothetical protein